MLLWIHPVVQALAALAAPYVLHLGLIRFRAESLGRTGLVFPWRRHARLGVLVMGAWALALASGLGAVWLDLGQVFITGQHYRTGLLMQPLILFGLGSGVLMDRVKAKRRLLPLAHGAVNAVLVLLALLQLRSGLAVLRGLVLG